jgi:hypothetical protein
MSDDRYLVREFLNASAPSITAELNKLASDGWRLIYVVDEFHYFERKSEVVIDFGSERDRESQYDRWLHAMDRYEDSIKKPEDLDF